MTSTKKEPNPIYHGDCHQEWHKPVAVILPNHCSFTSSPKDQCLPEGDLTFLGFCPVIFLPYIPDKLFNAPCVGLGLCSTINLPTRFLVGVALGKFCTVLKVMRLGHCSRSCCHYCYRPRGISHMGTLARLNTSGLLFSQQLRGLRATNQQCREVNAQGGELANKIKRREILPSFFPPLHHVDCSETRKFIQPQGHCPQSQSNQLCFLCSSGQPGKCSPYICCPSVHASLSLSSLPSASLGCTSQ